MDVGNFICKWKSLNGASRGAVVGIRVGLLAILDEG